MLHNCTSSAHIPVAHTMSCSQIHSSGPWIFRITVNMLGAGTLSAFRRESSVLLWTRVEKGWAPSRRQAARKLGHRIRVNAAWERQKG